jgi:hypothetical protein
MDHKNRIFNWGKGSPIITPKPLPLDHPNKIKKKKTPMEEKWSPPNSLDIIEMKTNQIGNAHSKHSPLDHPIKSKSKKKQTKEDSELPGINDDMEAITNQIDDADLKTFSGKLFPSVEVDEIPSGTMDPRDKSQNSTSEFSDSKHHPGKSHYRILMHLGTSPNPQASSLPSVHCVSHTCT